MTDAAAQAKLYAGLLKLLRTPICILTLNVCAQEQEADTPAWPPLTQQGESAIPYHPVADVGRFYKIEPGIKPVRPKAYVLGNREIAIEFGPGLNELSIGGVCLDLEYPLRKDTQGAYYISRRDWVNWLDPILRPTYITDRESVSTVIIDAGRGGHDTGVLVGPTTEARLTLLFALALQSRLEKAGLRSVLTRTGDYFISDRQRVDAANAYAHAIFLSLHLNTGDKNRCGPEVYVLSPAPRPNTPPHSGNTSHCPRDAALAYALQYALANAAEKPGGGCKYVYYSLLSSLNMPAVHINLGFATNEQEAAQLVTPAYQEKIVTAMAQGIAAYIASTAPDATLKISAPPPIRPVKPSSPPSSRRPRTIAPSPGQRNRSQPANNRRNRRR